MEPLDGADAVTDGHRHFAQAEHHQEQSTGEARPTQPRPPAAYLSGDAEQQHGRHGGAGAEDARHRVPLVELDDDRDLVDLTVARLAGRGRTGHRVEPVSGGGQPHHRQEQAAGGAPHLGPQTDDERDREHDDEQPPDEVGQPEEPAGRLARGLQFADVRAGHAQPRSQGPRHQERAVTGGRHHACDRVPGAGETPRRGANPTARGRRAGPPRPLTDGEIHRAYLSPVVHGLPRRRADNARLAGKRSWL